MEAELYVAQVLDSDRPWFVFSVRSVLMACLMATIGAGLIVNDLYASPIAQLVRAPH